MGDSVFLFEGGDPAMIRASQTARDTFRYFWRELHWESRRIIPSLDIQAVKLPFADGVGDGGGDYDVDDPDVEHMWISELEFDGDTITGTLLNAPDRLTSVRQGDCVSGRFTRLMDWMITTDEVVYGAFTVNLIRSRINPAERAAHDQVWRQAFGDPKNIRIEINKEPTPAFLAVWSAILTGSGDDTAASATAPPEPFSDHPMCVKVLPKVREQLLSDPQIAHSIGDDGWSLLHREAMAGNLSVVRLLTEFGADRTARTPAGHTPAGLARRIGWTEIAAFLDG